MSLYDDIDTKANDWSSKPSTSSIKFLQDHLQVKKTTTQSFGNKSAYKSFQLQSNRSIVDKQRTREIQHSSFNDNGASNKVTSPLGGDWDINQEYDPFRPNDYEKAKQELTNRNLSAKKWKKNEFEARPSLGLDYDDDEEEDYKDRFSDTKNGSKSSRPGASFAPPSVLLEGAQVGPAKGSFTNQNFKHADPVANMMAKMGYQPGQGLGREKQGITSALQVEKTGTTQGKIVLEDSTEETFEEISRVVLLRNLVGPNEVDDDLEEEIKEECSKYGDVLKCAIFQVPNWRTEEEAVRIFVEFTRTESAKRAFTHLSTRYFAGRRVLASFYNEQKFRQKCYM